MQAVGILGLLVCAFLGAGAGTGAHALCQWLKWNAYVALFFMLAFALFVFELLLRTGLLVKA